MRSRLLSAARSLLRASAAAEPARGAGAASCSRTFSNVVNQARAASRVQTSFGVVHNLRLQPASRLPAPQHRDTPLNNVETPFEFSPANAKQASNPTGARRARAYAAEL